MTDMNNIYSKLPEFPRFLVDLCNEILSIAYDGCGACERKGNERFYNIWQRIIKVVEQSLEGWAPGEELIDTYDRITDACYAKILGVDVDEINRWCAEYDKRCAESKDEQED